MRPAPRLPHPDQLLAERLSAEAFSSGDIGHYDALMALGAKANQAEDFPSAAIAYRAALALQQRKIGADNPGTVEPMLELALNLSDEGQYPQAATLFAAGGTVGARVQRPDGAGQIIALRGSGCAQPG